MSKKYVFYDRFAKTKSRLFILLLATVFVSFGTGLGILKISNIKSMGMGLETVYEDRVMPLKQLKTLSDMYGITIVNIADRVLAGTMSWSEGQKSLAESANRIPKVWNDYMQVRIVQHIREEEQRRIRITLNIGMASLVMSVILCVIVVLQWRRLRTLLEYF